MKALAIIPARGGSKSIPRKNIVPLGGKPLLAWTIEAARHSNVFERVVVSTDDVTIAEIARQWGAETPFLRPAELAQDTTPGMAPILHAIRWLDDHEGYQAEYVACLQPTSPFRNAQDLIQAAQLAGQKDADAVLSVAPVKHHPYWLKTMSEDGSLKDFMAPDQPITRRQDLPPVYALNGAIYLARCEMLLQNQNWYAGRTYAYRMPPERSLDIDTPWDLHLAELIMGENSHATD